MGRVGREAEEVAFYDGGARERDILTDAYMKLIKHVNSIYKVCLDFPFIVYIMYQSIGCTRFALRMSGLRTTSINIYGPLLVMVLSPVPILYTRTKRSLGLDTASPTKPARDTSDNVVAGPNGKCV